MAATAVHARLSEHRRVSTRWSRVTMKPPVSPALGIREDYGVDKVL